MNVRQGFIALCFLGALLWYVQLSQIPSFRSLVSRFEMDAAHTSYTEPVLPVYNCSLHKDPSKAEDILCMEPKTFLKNFKNPCWYEEDDDSYYGNDTSQRQTTPTLQCLPYFHIFGVCKTGTTDLFFRLTQHPQIIDNRGALNKETWYWSWKRYGFMTRNHTKMSFSKFLKMFRTNIIGQTKISIEDGREYSDFITGHGDPMDFWDHRFWRMIPQNNPTSDIPRVLTPHLVKHVQPNIKLIVMLREPTERLYSHYYHGGYGHSPENFHNDVVDAIKLMKACVSLYSFRTCLYGKNIDRLMNVPLTASLYYIHLKEWLDVFPRKQVMILRNEDYAKDNKGNLMKLFRFLDVDDISSRHLDAVIHMPHKYETKKKVIQGPMKNETLELLLDFFEEPNRKLSTMLNDTRFLWSDYRRHYRPKVKNIPHKHSERDDSFRMHYIKYNKKPGSVDKEKVISRRKWEQIKREQIQRMRNRYYDLENDRIKAENERVKVYEENSRLAIQEQKKRLDEMLQSKRHELAQFYKMQHMKNNPSKFKPENTHNKTVQSAYNETFGINAREKSASANNDYANRTITIASGSKQSFPIQQQQQQQQEQQQKFVQQMQKSNDTLNNIGANVILSQRKLPNFENDIRSLQRDISILKDRLLNMKNVKEEHRDNNRTKVRKSKTRKRKRHAYKESI